MTVSEVRNFNQRIVNSLVGVVGNVNRFPSINYWRLYLDGNVLERDVDTCATSQVTSILCHALKSCEDKYAYESCFDMICKSLYTVIHLRNPNGAWPSVIVADELLNRRNSGDNAIGDTYFALTSLCDAGFLDDSFQFGKYLSEEFDSLEQRIKFVTEAVTWLVNNKATNGGGWYYTDNKNDRIYSVSLTTVNVLEVFVKIRFAICNPSTSERYQHLYNLLTKEINEGINNLLCYQINTLTDSAIGPVLKHGEKASLLHTCKFFNLLLSLVSNDDKVVVATSKLFNHINANIIDVFVDGFNKIDADWLKSNYGFEFYTIQKRNTLDEPYSIINVEHENFIEGILLTTLIFAIRKNYNADLDVVNKVFLALIERGKNTSSSRPPLLACHSKRDKHNRKCPVYSSYEGYMALEAYANNYDLIYSSKDTLPDLTNPGAIQFHKILLAQIQRLDEFKNEPEHVANLDTYGVSIENCEKLIIKLKELIEKLSDLNYKQTQEEYKEILNQIDEILGH